MINILQHIKNKLSLPEASKLKYGQRNIKVLNYIMIVMFAFGFFMFGFVAINKYTAAVYYIYYGSITAVSLLSIFLIKLLKKINKYYAYQTFLIFVSSLFCLIFVFDLLKSSFAYVAYESFFIFLLLLTILLEINPIVHISFILVFVGVAIYTSTYNGIEPTFLYNGIILSICFIVFSFFKRNFTVVTEKQHLQIEEQNKLLSVQNIELERQKDSLLVNKKHLEDAMVDKEQELLDRNSRIIQIQNNTIISLSNLVENRDEDTGNHVLRTREYVGQIAIKAFLSGKFPELTENSVRLFMKAAPMHDIGKIVVPDAVLKKEGRLTPEEFEQIKLHTTKGGKIVEDVLGVGEDKEYIQTAKDIATSHHEKYDGTGYPYGLKGEDIPLCARIMAIADVFDALVSPRCYKEPFSVDKAYDIIAESSGTHFDPELAQLFIESRDEIERIFEKYKG